MSSRDKILNAVSNNQPQLLPLPEIDFFDSPIDPVEVFTSTLTKIGGTVLPVTSLQEVERYITENFSAASRKVSTLMGLSTIAELITTDSVTPHTLEDIELAVLQAQFGVAENGAVWITDENLVYRVLPFICQHLAIVLKADSIVANMHYAYGKIGAMEYGFGTFISGPSKTADIEQSLVLGAHGSRSMTIFLLQ